MVLVHARWRLLATSVVSAGLFLALPTRVVAQDPTPAEPAPEPQPPTTDAATDAASSNAEQVCRPSCREGYTCIDGQCVSACNPPCAEGEQCTAEARCVAQEQEQSPPSEEESVEYESFEEVTKARSARMHDGFYLRLGTGLGYMSASRGERSTMGGVEQSLTGFGEVYEISFGGSPAPGFVIGGGLYGIHVLTTKHTLTAVTVADGEFEITDDDVGSSTIAMLCPFVNLYFDPRSGLNGLAGPCAVAADLGDSELHEGFGVTLGVGGDWFVSDDWSLGLLLRFQYASVSYEDNEAFSVIIPGALFTATLN